MPTDLDILAAKVAELLDKPRKPQKRRAPLQTLHFRVSPEERAAIEAAATAKACNVSELIRIALNCVLPNVLQVARPIPAQFASLHARRKADRYHDGKTSVIQRNASIDRQEAGRHALRLGLQARALMQEAGAAVMHTQEAQGGMTDSAVPSLLSGKLSR